MTDAPVNGLGFTEDSFLYSITDGLHIVNARVLIKTIDTNDLPEQLRQIPNIVFTADDGVSDSHVRQINLSQYFWDPDGDTLTFKSSDFESTLGLSLSPQGILKADASSFFCESMARHRSG